MENQFNKVMELLHSYTVDNLWLAFYTSQTIEGFWDNFEQSYFQYSKGLEKFKSIDTGMYWGAEGECSRIMSERVRDADLNRAISNRYGVDCITHVANFHLQVEFMGVRVAICLKRYEIVNVSQVNCLVENIPQHAKASACIAEWYNDNSFIQEFLDEIEEVKLYGGLLTFIRKLRGVKFDYIKQMWKRYRFEQLLKTGSFELGDEKGRGVRGEVTYLKVNSVNGKMISYTYYRWEKQSSYRDFKKTITKNGTEETVFRFAQQFL